MANPQWQELAARIRGQRRWNEQLARDVLDRWSSSGLSGTAVANELGIDAQRLYWWRARLGCDLANDPHGPVSPTQFAQVVVREDARRASPEPLTIELPDGIRVHVNEADSTTAAWVAMFASSLREVTQ